MGRKIYKKLIRDGVIDVIIQDGSILKFTQLASPRLCRKIMRKILEQARELSEAKTFKDILAEPTDLHEAIRTILRFYGLTLKQLEQARKKKLKERGGFKKGTSLGYVDEK